MEEIRLYVELCVLVGLVRAILGEALDVLGRLFKLFLHGQCHGRGSRALRDSLDNRGLSDRIVSFPIRNIIILSQAVSVCQVNSSAKELVCGEINTWSIL